MPEWTVSEPRKLAFDTEVGILRVAIVGGAVNVVGTQGGPAQLEVSAIEGPPLGVVQDGSTLTIGYPDLPQLTVRDWLRRIGRNWDAVRGWFNRENWQRHAVVSLAVPAGTEVEVRVVSAAAVVSGVSGRVSVRGVDGDTTLVGVTGPVDARTVTGSLDAQSVSGDLRFSTVSGELTVVDGSGGQIRADSVSGAMTLDLDLRGRTNVRLNTVSGEVAIRLPDPGDARVDANTTSGDVSSAFEELRLSNQCGARRLTGTLGKGRGKLRVSTVSGPVALLRRPDFDDADATAGKVR